MNKMFEHNVGTKKISYRGKCVCCGCDIDVTVTKTSGGFGLQHGVLYETEDGSFIVECSRCYKNSDTFYLPRSDRLTVTYM